MTRLKQSMMVKQIRTDARGEDSEESIAPDVNMMPTSFFDFVRF